MKQLENQSFALIGVNVNEFESKTLKAGMEKADLPWRSFAFQESVNSLWNPSTPGYYLLDRQGVIRYKWIGAPGEKAIDKALRTLLEEAK